MFASRSCWGISTKHWFMIILCFILLYVFIGLFLAALLQVYLFYGPSTMWIYFVVFLLFLLQVGTAVAIGHHENTVKARAKAREEEEAMGL